jgi:hypothetical protein
VDIDPKTRDHIERLKRRWSVLDDARDRIMVHGNVHGQPASDPRLNQMIREAWEAYAGACDTFRLCRQPDCWDEQKPGHAHCDAHAHP